MRSILFTKKLALLFFLVISSHSFAYENNPNNAGLKIGGGWFAAQNEYCGTDPDCTYEGNYWDIGIDFSQNITLEYKSASGDNYYSTDKNDLKIKYWGLDIGSDFGTEWFRFYGKIGRAKISEPETYDGYYVYEAYQVTSNAYGFGFRFTFTGVAKGLYAQLEALSTEIDNTEVGIALVGLGYRF